MGRRTLPKLDPSIDFSGHISEVDDLQAPFCPQSLFSQTSDLEIEIGSGKGLFVLNESGKFPERNFIGNEIAHKYCKFSAYRLAKSGRTNAHMLRGDGLKFFRELLPDQCAVAVNRASLAIYSAYSFLVEYFIFGPMWKSTLKRRWV